MTEIPSKWEKQSKGIAASSIVVLNRADISPQPSSIPYLQLQCYRSGHLTPLLAIVGRATKTVSQNLIFIDVA